MDKVKQQLTDAIEYAIDKILESDEPQTDWDRMIAKIEFQEYIKAFLRENSDIPENMIQTIKIHEGQAELISED